MIKGIDVSSYQSETYSTSGLDFVFVKATEGTSYVNPKQHRQAATARTAGLALGFYHFLWPGDPEAQARYFVDKCASVHGDMLVCDWETTQGGAPSNGEKDAFLRAVKQLRGDTHKIGLYCNRDYWLTRDKTSYAADFLWIADPTAAGKPRIQAQWTFHQYSTSGGLDRNVGRFDSRAKLLSWCGYPNAPKPKPAKPTTEQRLTSLEKRVSALERA